MLKTKKDIDKHVADILGRLKSEQERSLRGYNFAKHYFNVKEYDAAKRHVSEFLSVKETHAPAHKLMGQIHEQFGHLEKAVQSYKRSLELDGNQKDVVLKLCELYCQIPVDPERARYWADRAEKLFPHSEVVFRLRESLVNVDGDQNPQELENLITNELIVRPRDVNLRVKLIKLYLDNERVKEAYDHAVQVERKRPHWDSIEWYYCLTDVFEAYLEEQGHRYDQTLCIQLLSALDRLVYLNILENYEANKENCNTSSQSRSMAASTALYSFDLHLFQATKTQTTKSDAWDAFINHMKGQLYLHMAMIILKRVKIDHGNQKEASRFGAVLLLSAYSFKPPDISKFRNDANDDDKVLHGTLYSQACYRLSQSGHVIMGTCREDKSKWLGKIREQVSTTQIKDKIYQRVFNNKAQKLDLASSCFMQSNLLSDINGEFPDLKSLAEYDLAAITLHPSNLHLITWICLQQYNPKAKRQPMYGKHIFKGLQFNHSKLENPVPESLCLLDVDAFLLATVRCSALANEDAHSFTYTSTDAPSFLPANICKQMCTDEQFEWWSTAYKMFTNTCSPEKVGEARRRLQHGIEVVRAVGNHGMDVNLIVYLARSFSEKASELKAQSSDEVSYAIEVKHLEARSELYWKAAISLLEKLLKNAPVRMPKDCLFTSYERTPSFDEVNKFLEEGRFFLACQAMNNGQLEEAIAGFEQLTSPYASFYQALVYKKLAAEEFGSKPRESITSEMRSRHVILLTQARQGFYRTLDRIGNDPKHSLNQALPEEIEFVEARLARIDPDTAVRPDCIASEESDTQESDEQDLDLPSYPANMLFDLKNLAESSPRPGLNISTPLIQSRKIGGTKRSDHVRPSPERLDAQIRSLTNWHDTVIQTIVEQNKSLMETNRAIVEELKQNKSVVSQLTAQLVELNKKIHILAKHPKPTKHSRTQRPDGVPPTATNRQHHFEDNEDEGEEEDYYDGYYYHEDDSEGEGSNHEKLEMHENPAYVYPEQPLNNDYRYGQNSAFPPATNFVYPSPQPGYSYFPATHGLAGTQMGPNVNGNLVHGHAAQSLAAMAPPHYYGSGPPAMFTGLPFSEGQKLPEFHFNVDSQIGDVPANNSVAVGQNSNVLSTINVNETVDGKFKFVPMKSDNNVGSVTPSIQHFGSTVSDVTSTSSAFMPAVAAPHAFQIPLPQNMSFQKDSITVQDPKPNEYAVLSTGNVPKSAEGSPMKGRNISRTESESYNEEDSLGPDFKPVIPMPAEVEVKTGEEDEKVLFEERAKLYRYVFKEWKERGVGIVKLLHNEKTDKVRLLMRRDQIFKICANHYLMPDMILKPMKSSDQMWIWAAQDFSEGQVVSEQFCIKFKTAEIGRQFKLKFDIAKELIKKKEQSATVTQDRLQQVNKEKEVETIGFGNAFKPKPGSWSCPDCYINNMADNSNCVACGKQNPSHVAAKMPPESSLALNVPTPTFRFGFSAASNTPVSSAVSFGVQPAAAATSFSTPGATHFKFGFNESSPNTNNEQTPPTGFVFGKSPQTKTSGFVFGATNVKSDAEEQLTKEENTADNDTNKFIFGGFSFTTSPVITVAKEPETKPVKSTISTKSADTSKPNPFSDFCFSSSLVVTPTKSNTEIKDEKKVVESLHEPVWGSKSTCSELSFGGIAVDATESEAFSKDPNFAGFTGSGTAVFSSSPRNKSAGEEFESTAQFKPVVTLPELVSVVTGEEEEEKLFGERAKLFRFSTTTKEWKERGIGELKIMKHKVTGRVRILMRREQILKVCANHYITETMKLQPMMSSDAAWIWIANDFSEGELREEKLAAKFKTAEIAKAFREGFESAQKSLGEKSTVKVENETVITTVKPLSELFKPKPGSWKCEICEVRNDESHSKCVSCGSDKVQEKPCGGFNLAEMFKPEEGSWKCGACLVQNKQHAVNCVACLTSKPEAQNHDILAANASQSQTWKFGFTQSTPKKTEVLNLVTTTLKGPEPDSTSSGFSFAIKTPVFQFGSTSPSKVEFQFGTSQSYNFNFGGIRPKSPAKTPKSPVEENVTEGEAEDDTTLDSEGDSIYFHPVIPLPDKVEIRTGEEDEDVLYCQHAKLFRWADGEWKERGVGDFKILCHKVTKKFRLFMRRKPILKVCCNHYLTGDMKFNQKDDRSWMWNANDFSEHELKQETLVLRFKTADISQSFKDALEYAQQQINTGKFSSVDVQHSNESFKAFSFKPVEPKTPPSTFSFGERFGASPPFAGSIFGHSTSSNSVEQKSEELGVNKEGAVPKRPSVAEVEVVEEKLPDNSLRLKAKSLLLPSNFYNYEQAPDCPGCRGCYSSDDEGETVGNDVTIVFEKKPTEEQIAKATALFLPSTFYLYEDLPNCPGCRGCTDHIPEIGPEREIKINQDIQNKNENNSDEKKHDKNMPFMMASSNGFSFADLSRQTTTFLKSDTTNPNFKFAGAGAKLFTVANVEEDGEENDEIANPDPQFQPVIPLPELVTVVTGEENEDKLFGERCKLYRFDSTTKQWKERGIGEMKILQNRSTAKCRLLMRREQVHKTVCNQAITANIEMKRFTTSESAWCWVANDFSGGNQEVQHFAVRFKTSVLADEFFSIYVKCQNNCHNADG